MTNDLESDGPGMWGSGRALVLSAIVAGALFLAYLVLGMPGMDHGTSGDDATMEGMDHGSVGYVTLSAEDFAARISGGGFVVNVHEPYDGEIGGTDAFIRYDAIVGDRRLPTDTDSSILLYCRSGQMSATAAGALVGAGYTDVAHLEGGMEAWEAAGMPLRRERPPEDG